MGPAEGPATGPDAARVRSLLILAVGAVIVVDAGSHLVLAFAGWTPETPLRRLAALQTVGTQVTVGVLAALLAAIGWRADRWPASRHRGVALLLGLLAVASVWFASRIPGLTSNLLQDVSFTAPERLVRGSRQAMAGWLVLAIWSASLGLIATRAGRRRSPLS